MKYVLKNGNVITPHEILKGYDVLVEDGTIKEVGQNLTGDIAEDFTDKFVCPGLVDIHTHGGGGGDYMDAEKESFEMALDFQSKNGITSVLATSVTAPLADIQKMIDATREYMKKEDAPCRILGVHMEGPYLSMKNKGAQHESYIRVPDKSDIDFVLSNKDVVKYISIAPEVDGAEEFTKALVKDGITVSGGHDDGYKEKILPVIRAGLSNCTHWYCAMSTASIRDGIRQVGLMELGLNDPRLTLELIADGFHITTDLMRLAYNNKGADKLCVISDCLRAGGLEDKGETYTLGSKHDPNAMKFIISVGVARLPDGSRYAGSIQPISRMVKRFVDEVEVPLADAIKMASLTPAKSIKMDKYIGSIEPGKYGDFCIMDKDLTVVQTIVGGRTVYKKD